MRNLPSNISQNSLDNINCPFIAVEVGNIFLFHVFLKDLLSEVTYRTACLRQFRIYIYLFRGLNIYSNFKFFKGDKYEKTVHRGHNSDYLLLILYRAMLYVLHRVMKLSQF